MSLRRTTLLIAILVTFGASASTAAMSEPFRSPARPLGVPTGSSSDSLFGFVTSNMTITKSAPGPVWHVIGDLYVQPGVTLTIEPGVTLLFDSNSDLLNSGSYYYKSEILVSGTLLANGAADDSIRFQSASGLGSSWGQILINGGATTSFNYCSFRDADVAVRTYSPSVFGSRNHVANGNVGIESWATSIVVRQWTFNGLASGVRVVGINAEIADCRFWGPLTNAIRFTNDGSIYSAYQFRIHHCVFAGLTTALFNDKQYPGDVLVNYCTFDNNVTSITSSTNGYCLSWPSLNVRNSIITNTNVGGSCSSALQLDYCDRWNGSSGFVAFDSANVSINPLYVDSGNRDYRLRSFSPLRILGENGTQMGAFGAEGNVVGVPDGPSQPGLVAQPAKPNPFQASTELSFTLRIPSEISVTILDSSGRLIRTLMTRDLGSGVHRITWNGETDFGKQASSGVYYWRVASAGESAGGRLTLVR